jgi:L-ascorbate metabolism protein UlaG (beta-lactamase superfamily)
MIIPAFRDAQFVARVHAAMAHRDAVTLWWLGQSGYLVHHDGVCIAIDPYLSDSLTAKYANTDKPHVRLSERVVDPALLSMVSLVTSSHNHTDHLDATTYSAIRCAHPHVQLACGAANVAFAAERMQIPVSTVVGMTEAVPYRHGPFLIHVVPAAHNELLRDAAGHPLAIGLVIEVAGRVIYHSGDTLRYDGMVESLRRWHIDVAILPINGNDPGRGVAGNLSALEAAQLAEDIDATTVIPCHYDLFAFNTADPISFTHAAGPRARVLALGDALTF